MRTPKRVLWLTADHMRYDCLRAYGNEDIHTPNLDLLANNGVNFHSCYSQSPVCMPSRASFMTGLYPQQTGVTGNGYTMPPDFEPVAPHLFRRTGYQTTQIGKLHLQPHEQHDMEAGPRHTYGFDVFWPSESRGCYDDAWMKWLRGKYPDYEHVFRIPRVHDRTEDEKKGKVLEAPWEASHSGWIAHVASQYLKPRKATKQFMHLGFHNPHPPLNPTRAAFELYESANLNVPFGHGEWGDKPKPLSDLLQSHSQWSEEDFIDYKRYFYALITEMDLAIGKLISSLREEGMLDDTLIIFSSDHGDMCGDHRMTLKGHHFYDEVMHTPLIMFWPSGFGTDRRDIDAFVENMDILPTVFELSGGIVPNEIAGQSYAEELLSGKPVAGKEDVYAFYGPDWAMLRNAEYKYIRYNSMESEVLYDLSLPDHEVDNVAEQEQYQDALQQMRLRMLSRTMKASRTILPRKHLW